VERVGAEQDFFELGGDSLSAARLLARVRSERGRQVPLARFFARPTVRALAEELAAASPATALVARTRTGARPLSSVQERLRFLETLEPGRSSYNVALLLRFTGARAGDGPALARAIAEVTRRHETLRSRFSGDRAIIDAAIDVTVRAGTLDEARRHAAQAAQRPFDLERDPLMRAAVFRAGERELALSLTLHHAVFDGWSTGVLMNELAALYDAYAAGRPSPLAEPPLQYADWVDGEARALSHREPALLEFWRRQLFDLAPLELPTDRPTPAVRSRRGARVPLRLDGGLTGAVAELAREERTTPFVVLLTALKAVLARHTGQRDIAVGTPVANRSLAETHGLLGCFLNTIVLRTRLDGELRFRDALARTRSSALDSFAHQELPFDRLVAALAPERSAQVSPLFRVLFVMQTHAPARLERQGFAVEREEPHNGGAMFDLTLSLEPSGEGLYGHLEYDCDLFDRPGIALLAAHLETFLQAATARPDARIGELPLLPTDEQRRLREWNATARPGCGVRCVHDQFADQAALTPDAIAVTDGTVQLTYRELDRRSNQLANHLVATGAARAQVGTQLEESVDKAVAVLGILKAGGAIVPLDPSYPAERRAFMVEDAHLGLILTRERIAESAGAQSDPPRLDVAPEELVYVLYTSGSTGRPKGVALPHRALANLIDWHNGTLTTARRTLQFSPLSFDASFHEMFAAWCSGGTVVLADPAIRRDPALLAQTIARHAIEKMIVPVVVLEQLAERYADAPQPLRSLREVLATAEQLKISRAIMQLFSALPGCSLHNHYGPTETHVVTAFTLGGEPAGWPALPPIGRPIANTQIHILDRALREAPVGVVGELYVAGDSLARGYLYRPDLTAERFLPNPLGGGRIYRTGDLARWLPGGEIEFLGRRDHQVKVRGFRIELGEVESVLGEHCAIRQCAVVAREQRLVAYVVCASQPPPAAELRGFLARRLPDYMLPSLFVPLSALPMTPSGKVDTRALPAAAPARDDGYVAPRNPTEQRLAEIWADQLAVEQIGVHDNFFEIGGHSLVATRVMARISRAFSLLMSPRELFDHPTVGALAERLERLLLEEIEREPGAS
jgi:amino acid adenylation domain-containing protein